MTQPLYSPDYEEFEKLAAHGNLVPVHRDILADLETPVSAFLKIDDGGDAFLLESVEGGETWGRYSFIGVAPQMVFTTRGHTVEETCDGVRTTREVEDPFLEIRSILARYKQVPVRGLPRFSGGLVGYLSYDVVRFFEKLPERSRDDLGLPDQYLMLVDTVLAFDNTAQKIKVLTHAHIRPGESTRVAYDRACEKIEEIIARLRRPVPVPASARNDLSPFTVRSNMSEAEYENAVLAAKEYITAGDIIQVVLSQRFECALRCDPFNIYRMLRTVNPSPYMFFLRCGGQLLIGTSPEVMARLEGREVTVRPIAGTRPRGTEEREDKELERELATDPKEIAEHIMLLDLGRNDVGRVSDTGTVQVTEKLVVERYSHVMHLVSNVTGQLNAGMDCFDAFRATFPAGTLSGAPKIRAMEIIDELEPVRRGPYGGAVGYFDFSGNMDTCITIRTAVVKDGRVYVGAGAGIVYDSDPEREHAECVNKSRALLQAVRLAEAL